MSIGVSRALIAAGCLVWLAGCESAGKMGHLFGPPSAPDTTASVPDTAAALADASKATADALAARSDAADLKPRPVLSASSDITGSVYAPIPKRVAPEPPPLGPFAAAEDPTDELSLGKRHFREGNYGNAEMHFRRVVEQENIPAQRKAEAWVGLAASYDRLKRFDLADRAYGSAIAILGPTPEILNNQGFSYMLRGDYVRARAKLTQAIELDPTNPYIRNNINLLEKSMRGGGGRKKV
jgi:tetratricopeptide (TPR) repeat protein